MTKLNRRELVRDACLAVVGSACALPVRASWAARGGRRGRLRLVFFADVHARVEWQTPLALERAAAAINARRPELIIAGGDLITDGFQSGAEVVEPRWQAYLEMHRALKAPVEPVLGNHDLVAAIPEDGSPALEDPRSVFRSKFAVERTYRSFDAEGYHVVILDSTTITGGDHKYRGLVGQEQLTWLRQDLSRVAPGTPVILVSHIPLLTGYYQAVHGATHSAPINRVVVNNREVLEALAEHDLVLVLQAHLHVNEMLRWRETTFITGGAVCGRWWRGAWHGTREGFGVVTLNRDRVDWEYVEYGWTPRRPPDQ